MRRTFTDKQEIKDRAARRNRGARMLSRIAWTPNYLRALVIIDQAGW